MKYLTLQQREEYEKQEEFRSKLAHYLSDLYYAEKQVIDYEDYKNQISCDKDDILKKIISFEEYCCNLGDDEIKKLKEFWSIEKLNNSNVLSNLRGSNDSENIQIFTSVTEHIQNKLDFLNSLTPKSTEKIIEKNEKMEQIQKIVMLHEFGIIQYLDKLWEENKIKTQKVENLISSLIDEPIESIRPRLSNPNDPKLNTEAAITKSSQYLSNFSLEKGKIIKPHQK